MADDAQGRAALVLNQIMVAAQPAQVAQAAEEEQVVQQAQQPVEVAVVEAQPVAAQVAVAQPAHAEEQMQQLNEQIQNLNEKLEARAYNDVDTVQLLKTINNELSDTKLVIMTHNGVPLFGGTVAETDDTSVFNYTKNGHSLQVRLAETKKVRLASPLEEKLFNKHEIISYRKNGNEGRHYQDAELSLNTNQEKYWYNGNSINLSNIVHNFSDGSKLINIEINGFMRITKFPGFCSGPDDEEEANIPIPLKYCNGYNSRDLQDENPRYYTGNGVEDPTRGFYLYNNNFELVKIADFQKNAHSYNDRFDEMFGLGQYAQHAQQQAQEPVQNANAQQQAQQPVENANAQQQPHQPVANNDVQQAQAAQIEEEPIAEPVAEPIAEPVAEPIAEPVAEPIAEPIAEPVAEPVAEPIAEPVAEHVAEHVAEPVAEPIAEPIAEPVENDNVQQQAQQPVAEQPQQPVAAEQPAPIMVLDAHLAEQQPVAEQQQPEQAQQPVENNNVQQQAQQPVAEQQQPEQAQQPVAAEQQAQAQPAQQEEEHVANNNAQQPVAEEPAQPAQQPDGNDNAQQARAAQQNNPNPIFTVRHTIGNDGYNLENAPAMSRTYYEGTHIFTGYGPNYNQSIAMGTEQNNEEKFVFRNIPEVKISKGNQHYTFDNARVVRVKRSGSIDENDGQLHIDRQGNFRINGQRN